MNGSILIGGKTYPLYFTVNRLCMAEERAGKPLLQLMDGSFGGMRLLLWCGLTDEKITPEETGELMQRYFDAGASFADLSSLLADALEDAGFFRSPPAATGS